MFETFFGFKKSPFASSPDPKQLFESGAWTQLKARLQFLTDHRGAGLLTGEAGSGKSTAARTWLAGLNPNLYKIIYLHWSSGSALDLLRQLAREPVRARLLLGIGALPVVLVELADVRLDLAQPVLGGPDGVAGHLDCTLAARHEAGDHVIFIGEVQALDMTPDKQPLLFHGGGYRLLQEQS